MTTITDFIESTEDFQELLATADDNASGDWETQFVSDMNDRFEKYGFSMFISVKQFEILERIGASQ